MPEGTDKRNFDIAHKMAADHTAIAEKTSNSHQAEYQKYLRSQKSSSASVRLKGKQRFCNYLKKLYNDLRQASQSHNNAIERGRYFVRTWVNSDSRPYVLRTTQQLEQAKKNIDKHASAIKKERNAYGCR